MKYVLTHYQGDWTWVKEYTEDFLIYNRSEEEIPGSITRKNVGDADFDRLSYIIDNYYALPDVFLLAKSNLFKYISKEEFELVKDNQEFTPLLTQNHHTYEPICRYDNGMYEEINNSWYLASVPSLYFNSYGQFAHNFRLPSPDYLKFAPGGNYILTRERIHRYAVDYYKELANVLPYCQRPGEAQMLERSYLTIWG